jgi:hypothetical protein
MKAFTTVLLATTFVAFGAVGASAQSGTSQGGSPAAGTAPGGNISAATHCIDANGQARLKSQVQGSGSGSAQTSGSAAGTSGTGSARATNPAGSPPGGNVMSSLSKC